MSWKEMFQLLLSEDRIDSKKCLRLNGTIGGLCLISSIVVLVLLKIQPPKFAIPPELVYVQLILGVVFGSGWIFKASNRPMIRFLLVLHGVVCLVFVAVYTWFFFYIIFLSGGYKGFQRIGHAPGILALISAYGTRLCLDFIPIKVKRKPVILISFVIGAICDLIVLYAFIRLIPIIMASFR